jgi:sigma-B regulation protein RsbU (phosphoserine phosphatase)
MISEDYFDKYLKLMSGIDPRISSLINQLLEYRALNKDKEINNQLLQELVFKYAELEKGLIKLNQELIRKQDRIEQDLIAAGEIQKSLLPTSINCRDLLEVAWKFRPCEKIGGDLFNIIQLNDEHWAFYMIDVAGHGVSAAMVAVTVFQYLETQGGNLLIRPSEFLKTQKIQRPARVLEFLDREYTFERFDNFFTMNYVVLNTKTGRLAASSAGHPPPIILRKDGTLELLKKGGRPIGTIDLRLSDDEPIVFEEEHALLYPADKLLLYTDGVNEYQNEQGEFYGNERFYKKLKQFKDLPVSNLTETLFKSLMNFGNNIEPKDDISLLGVELKNFQQ